MAFGMANESPAVLRTICLPIPEERYRQIMDDPRAFRAWLLECFQLTPELFPEGFAQGFSMKDRWTPRKITTPLTLRRILLRDGTAYSVRPAFVMPYLSDGVQLPHGRRKARNGLHLESHIAMQGDRRPNVPPWEG